MQRQHLVLGFVGYLCIGMVAVLIPSLMPSITHDFVAVGVTLSVIGLIVPAGAAGSIVGTLLAGVGSDLLGRRQLVGLAALLLALAGMLTASALPWMLFAGGMVVMSMAQGALSTGINALIADAGRAARARVLNLLHGVYGLGAALSPVIIGWLINVGVPWRWVLAGVASIWLVYSLVVCSVYWAERSDTSVTKKRPWNAEMLRSRPFLALFLVACIYNGVAVSLLSWVALFTQQSAGLSAVVSVSMVSVFYIALTTGRFVCALIAERLGYTTLLFLLACGITLTYPLVVVGSNPVVVGSGVFLTGLSLSGLYPISLAEGARRYPEQTGTVAATLSVGLTLGNLIPPLWTSVVAGLYSLQVALGVNYGLVLLLFILARYLHRNVAYEKETQQAPVRA